MNVAAGLLPVFFALAIGYGAGKLKIVDNKHVDVLNTVVMSIALPIALFAILAGAERADVLEHSSVAAAVFMVMAVTYAAMYALQRYIFRQTASVSAVQSLTVAFPNTAAIGLPIADAVLGHTGELAVAISLAVGAITLSPLTITIVNRNRPDPADGTTATERPSVVVAFLKALRTPVVIAPILGAVWTLTGVPFPSLLASTLDELGGITAGLALFVTGLVLSNQKLRLTGNVTLSTLFADVARPVIALLVVVLLGLSSAMAVEVVVLMAVPCGFFGVLLALGRRVPAGAAGPTLFYSTLLSAATLSVVIALLPAG